MTGQFVKETPGQASLNHERCVRCFLERVARVLICVALLAPAAATSAQDEKVSLNFVNADIEEVVKAVSHITGRNFLVDPRVKGTINIISSTPVSASLAYDILLSALRLQGFASVESGGVTKLMPEADAKLHAGAGAGARGAGDRLVTRVYVLKYESAAQLVPILRPLIAPNNIVVAYPNSNTLVVTDYASNLKRIEQIVESIDQPGTEAPAVIPLKRASAVDVAQTINRLLQDAAAGGGGDASQRFALAADARTNSLLLRTDNPARIARVRDLAEKLDTDTGVPGNIHVVYLKNAEAVKVAQTLRAVMSGDASAGAATAAQGSGAQSATPSGGGMIQADAASNALIITAPDAIYNNLRAVVEKLDVRRAQVFVEALIVEVTADKAAEFGVQWQSLGGTTGTQVGGGTNFGGEGANILSVAGSIAKGAPVIGNGLNIGILRGNNLGVLARALENDANANILSTPNLLTLDNEEAKIIIGQNVPFITGSYAQTGNAATATPFQTIERKDVGLTLRIKPQISEGGTVKLQIYQEVSSVQDKTINNAAGVVTNKRSLESSVLADEGQIIVLGGLIQDSVSNGEDKVPLLGDIPVLGNLFRHETRRHTKTNLMVFIRPYVLRAAADSNGLTQDRYEYLRGEQKNSQLPARALLPDMPAPELPELTLKQELSLPSPSGKEELPLPSALPPPTDSR
ncbi:MAG: type II secretion system secretin GspD [Nitrosomonadales bacterium]|nr:type II secretion system secretin GspD [Nitrosomonadales bacterium]